MDTPLVADDGTEVDALFSGSSVSNRIINSPIIVGLGEQILIEIEKQAKDMYFK